jgi:transposase
MAFREVTMLEVKEVLRLWLMGRSKKSIGRLAGVDRNTVRRYIKIAIEAGIGPPGKEFKLSDDHVANVITRLNQKTLRERGETWNTCVARRSFIEKKLEEGLLLSKVHRLLKRHGVMVPYTTLHRYATSELDFGHDAPSIPVADCDPGQELQLDTGWMTLLEPDIAGHRKRFKAWIFTSVRTRHRFVYPILHETTESAIEACEAAWKFFGGIFHVLIPDNTKAIIQTADPLAPVLNETFFEYVQACGFVVDPTRVKHPKDKARVERSVPTVREDCFRGEKLHTIEQARERAVTWCLHEYGKRRHTTTQRLPLEYFEAEEKSCLLPVLSNPYDIPIWCDPKVGPDQLAVVAKALYSLPFEYRKKHVRARADRHTVRFYYNRQLIKVRNRQPAGARDIDPSDFPAEKAATALRDVAFFQRQAEHHGKEVGLFASALLGSKMPWVKLRRVYALLGLCKRYGSERVNDACKTANAAGMDDVKRLGRMLKLACPNVLPEAQRNVVPLAKYLRPNSQYALPLTSRGQENQHSSHTTKEGETT